MAGPQVDPSLGFQPVQGLTDRLPADPELAGQLGFDQMLAGAEGPAHDELDQGLIHGLP